MFSYEDYSNNTKYKEILVYVMTKIAIESTVYLLLLKPTKLLRKI